MNSEELDQLYAIDVLADEAGGYFAFPSEEDLAYTDLFFSVCRQFGIRYASATPKERYFVDEVTRVTWARQQEQITGVKIPIRPAFSRNDEP